jgi:hypothetical protein
VTGTNGKPVITEEVTEREPYRPTACIQDVHDAIVRSLSQIVYESSHQATKFVSLFELYDKNATLAVRYGHLVDAAECLEIAMTHLGQLKSAVSHRLLIEDEQNTGTPGF